MNGKKWFCILVCAVLITAFGFAATQKQAAQVKIKSPALNLPFSKGIVFAGDPIMRDAAGDPIMLKGKKTATGDPIMLTTLKTAGGDPIMMDAKGNFYILNAAGDPIMSTAAGDPIM